MDQYASYPQRASVPNAASQYGLQQGHTEQRSFSVDHAAVHDNLSASANIRLQWRDWQSPSTDPGVQWQQHQQIPQRPRDTHQTGDTNSINILGEVNGLLQNRSNNDAPWNPHGYHEQVFDAQQFRPLNSGAFTAIPDTRSQQGSFANDSAYASQSTNKQPVSSEETFDERSAKLLSPFDLAISHCRANRPSRTIVSDGQVRKKPKRFGGSARKLIQCPRRGCTRIDLKNKSDLQKHLNQHDKPHICQEHGCDREEGFGTANDLERHRASVHHLIQKSGTTAGFICEACEQSNTGAPKWWPRKDNFKAHIGRKHPEWDADRLVDDSRRDGRPRDTMTELPSVASNHGHEDARLHQDFFGTQHEPTHSALQLYSRQTDGEIVAGGGQWVNLDSPTRHALPARVPEPCALYLDELDVHSPSALDSFDLPPTRTVLHSRNFTTSLMQQPESSFQHVSQQADNKPAPSRSAVSTQSTGSGSMNASRTDTGHTCPSCGTTRKRACDLRKHQKRHTRPYGCTFPRCFKRFGSRNDWKRHENKQHLSKDQWRCQLNTHNGSRCAKLFETKEDMSAHLVNRHGNEGYHPDNPVHFDAIDRCHLGGERHHSFWCGFCNTLIPRPQQLHEGSDDPRLQHIGDHVDKDKLTIDDWIDLEENKERRLIAPPRSAGRQTVPESSADDSDLGEDGIPTSVPRAAAYAQWPNGLAGYLRD